MSFERVCRVFALILLSSAVARSQDWEQFAIRVCNSGTLNLDVAYAERKQTEGLPWSTDYKWKVEGWISVKPKECELVWKDREWESGFSTKTLPTVDLIFAFRDSTGTWGAAALADDAPLTRSASGLEFCVRQDAFSYTMPKGEPASRCDSGFSLVRASASFVRPHVSINSITGAVEGADVDIQITDESRAIPFSPKESTSAAAQNPAPPPSRSSEDKSGWSDLSQLATSIQASRQEHERQLIQEMIGAGASGFTTGFESYRRGPAEANGESWLIPNPGQTEGCFFRAPGDYATHFGCDLFSSASRVSIDAYYAEWLKSAMAVIPSDWQRSEESGVNNGLPAERFTSASGLSGVLYIGKHPEIGKYVLFFEVLLPK